jgi:uncharacterized lipoprotein YbaY
MKFLSFLVAGSLAAMLVLTAGCQHLSIAPEGDPERVLTGRVTFGARISVPQDAVLTVRLVDMAKADAPIVLGEQTITDFAEDALLRRGLNLEARIAVRGKLRFYTKNHHVVTLANADAQHELAVEYAGGTLE